MSSINFLPDRFIRQRRTRRRVVFESLLIAAIVAGLFHAYKTLHIQIKTLDQEASEIALNGKVARAKAEEAGRLQQEFNRHATTLRVQREVGLPISHSHVLAVISSMQPKAVGLTELIIECDRPKPIPPVDPNAKKAKPSRKKIKAAKSANELRIQLVGYAPDDGQITDFFGRMDNHKLFTDVKLEYTRRRVVDNLITRRFRITCYVRLDRQYRSRKSEEELADAN